MEHLNDADRARVARQRWRTGRLMSWGCFYLMIVWTAWLAWLGASSPDSLPPLGPVIAWVYGTAGAIILGYLGLSTFDPQR